MISLGTIKEWLAGRSTRDCLVVFRDRANAADNAAMMSKDAREVTDMLVEAMEDNPRLSLAIMHAVNIYKRNTVKQ